MARLSLLPVLVALAGTPLLAQEEAATGRCSTPDSIAVRGNQRVGETTIRADAQLTPGQPLNFRGVQRAIRSLFATGQFTDVRLLCDVAANGRSTLVIEVAERPLLGSLGITGVSKVPERTVREKVDLLVNRPLDPNQLARAIQRIDSVYEKAGYYLAQVTPDTQTVDGKVNLTIRIDEGRRLAISGIRVNGNSVISDEEIVGEMETKPEGFWWFRRGEFNEDEYASDLGERIAGLYAKRGFIDFQIIKDSLVVDRERGKALLDITVSEGKQYRVGSFESVGNSRFSTEEIRRFYPFGDLAPTLTQRVRDLLTPGAREETNVFDQAQWEDATGKLRTAYSNEGYIYAQVRPVIDRVGTGGDSVPVVNLRWEIEERSPAIVNRVDIVGNDYTTEACIRDALLILPGDVFNQDRLVRSYQNIANLGFFETPLPPPDTRPAGEEGDVDIVFAVKEKRTGSINFGASVGEGTGVGGFLGLDQPNLFGQCKRASLQWQFGANQKEFSLSFTDPAIQRSRISGTVSVYHRRLRYIVEDYGRSVLSGGSLQFGFPVPRSPFTRIFVSYGGERVEQRGGIFEQDTSFLTSGEGFRSTLGLSAQRDTRIGLPFPTAGSLQNFSASFNGGPLGGNTAFQRYTTELKAYAPLWTIGGERPGSQPLQFTLGLSARAGTVFGDVGAFIVSQKFGLGGVMFGEPLRGYKEFSITPNGFDPNEDGQTRASFGDAFFTTTAELGLRLNSQVYLNMFFDAGNIWDHPREFDPTRLFRGAGIGVSLITPLGPLGLDWAYGFDRTDRFGRPDPKWELHFRLGNLY
ncbi:MAG TPA: outer membrane protein assembly factor BamA [Gemmatimonadaceae bacterium]|nr:outer membrane protein assembly factor BamA [Gemmatimonadaceae bacterium]